MTLVGPESEFGQIIMQYITNAAQLSVEDRRFIRQLIVDKTPPEERNHFISLVNIPRTSTASAIHTPPMDTSFFHTNSFVFGGTPPLMLGRMPPPPPPPLPPSNNKSVENEIPKSEH
jgi:hypothetical protein